METLKKYFYFFVSQWLGCVSTHSSPLILQVEALQSLHKYPRPTQYENVRTLFKQLQTATKYEVTHLKLFKISELVSDGKSHPRSEWNTVRILYTKLQSVA